MNDQEKNKTLNFFEVLMSTLAAVIGVQSKALRDRDFTRGNIFQFITAGVLFTAIFVLVMVSIVKAVLA